MLQQCKIDWENPRRMQQGRPFMMMFMLSLSLSLVLDGVAMIFSSVGRNTIALNVSLIVICVNFTT
jgi:hypothetical protein